MSACNTPRNLERPTARPRICSILTSLTSGGAEVLVTNLNTCFAPEGVRACVVTLCDAPALGNSASMESELAGRLEAVGCRVRSLSLPPRRGLVAGALALRRLLREERLDIIHAHTVRAVLMLALAGCRCPIVFTHHNSRLSFPPWLFRLLDRIVDHYVAISADTAAIYCRHSTRPFILIPNAPATTFRAEKHRSACAARPRIITVGAISPQKNYALLIETARVLWHRETASQPTPLFRVVGDGADLEAMRRQVCQLGLEHCVKFLGERSDIAALLADSDIYLNTSRYEGFSIAILEALSSAIPVVATDVPGNRGLVKTGENGMLCPPDRPIPLATAISRLACDQTLYRQLSSGAMRSAREHTIEIAAQRHLDLYAALLRRRRSPKD
jgi:glycosyltransferase involved in cell wall biosynthesis